MEKSYNALKNSSAGAVPMFLVSTADELREDTAAEATPDQTIDTASTAGTAGTAGTGGKNKKKKKQSTVSATAFLQTLFFIIKCNLFFSSLHHYCCLV